MIRTWEIFLEFKVSTVLSAKHTNIVIRTMDRELGVLLFPLRPSFFTAVLVLMLFSSLVASPPAAFAALSFNVYSASCPSAEFIVANSVRSASAADPTIPGKLLRLLFHDCFVEGCDASVLLQGNATERSDPANRSLGGFSVIDSAKRTLEILCPETVSCADIVALASRDAVAVVGGPLLEIPTGRRDGRVSAADNVRSNTVDTSFTMDEMTQIFSFKGLSLEDLVILSVSTLSFRRGSHHRIGSLQCSDRFKGDSKGNLAPIDSSLDRSFADRLIKQCPAGANPSVVVNIDLETSSTFDNQYYSNLLARQGLFQLDSVFFEDPRTRKLVEEFANDQERFFQGWSQSFTKLVSFGVKMDEEGEILQSPEFI